MFISILFTASVCVSLALLIVFKRATLLVHTHVDLCTYLCTYAEMHNSILCVLVSWGCCLQFCHTEGHLREVYTYGNLDQALIQWQNEACAIAQAKVYFT